MNKFRFQDLEIWKDSMDIAIELFRISDRLEQMKLFSFSGQLRSAGMSVSNNIAEGSGSRSNRDFANFLNIAVRSAFENANMLILLHGYGVLKEEEMNELLRRLNCLCARINKFREVLLTRKL